MIIYKIKLYNVINIYITNYIIICKKNKNMKYIIQNVIILYYILSLTLC